MQAFDTLGLALQHDYGAFASSVATISIRCGQGGPGIPPEFDMESRPSSTSNVCLKSGVCVEVGKVRARPAYASEWKNCHNDDPTACRHSFVSGSHGSRRTGGIFCWYCRHEICYVISIADLMPNAEGRNGAFSFLYKYFAVAPKVVVYDFSCALQDYCLNRQDFSMTHARLTALQPENCLPSFCWATSIPEHPNYPCARRAAA